MTVYNSVIISLSSILLPTSDANYWTSKARSTRSTKGALASHAYLSRALFYKIMSGSIGHCAIACSKISCTRVFWDPQWSYCNPVMSLRGNASCIWFLDSRSMLSHYFLSRRDSLCAHTNFPDCIAVNPIAMTGGCPGSGGTTYGVFISTSSYCDLIVLCLSAWIRSRGFTLFPSSPGRTHCSLPPTLSVC